MYFAICMFDRNLKMKRAKELSLICLLSLLPALFYLASFIFFFLIFFSSTLNSLWENKLYSNLIIGSLNSKQIQNFLKDESMKTY